MVTKLVMSWNVRPETESEYFEFLVHEFIPGLNKIGIREIQVWYTAYGDCEQKMASGVTPDLDQMKKAMNEEIWFRLKDKLNQYVEEYSQKIIEGTRGFQI